jgi:hypothetical protein
MAVNIGTDTYRFGHVFKHVYEPSTGYCFDAVTANEAGAKTYAVGSVLGKVTATGKYKLVEATAVDGSQNAVAVVAEDKAVAAATDTVVLAAVRGLVTVGKGGLIVGASVDTVLELAAVYASLATVGIVVQDTI